MNIDLREVTVRELVDGYADDGEGRGYGGRLDVRTIDENCQILCRGCNRRKSDR